MTSRDQMKTNMATARSQVQGLLAWSRDFLRSGFGRVVDTSDAYDSERDSTFVRLLGPFEAYLVSIQSLLIWERPYLSAVALVAVNCFFWLVVSCSKRFYSFVAVLAAAVFMYKTWVNNIWPEIRVPPSEDEDTEQWTHLNPQVLSVPELNRYLTDWSRTAGKWIQNIIVLRRTNPGLFCILSTSTLAMTAVLGRMVSGVLILYSLLMAVSLGPGIALYVIPATWYEQFEALLRVASGKAPKRRGSDGSDVDTVAEEDNELDQFLPQIDQQQLSRQLSLSLESDSRSSARSEDGTPAEQHGSLLLGALAEEESQLYPSGTFPDYDADTDLDSFLPDLSTMPSLNESLPPPNNDNGGGGDTSTFTGAIHFVTSHFRQESSDSEVDEAFVARLEAGRRHTRSRGSEASQSRPLSVGPAAPHSSRLSSQGSDIDIDEYELIDRSELPSST